MAVDSKGESAQATNAVTRDGEGRTCKRSRVSCDRAANAQAMEGLGWYPSEAG